MKLPPLDLVTPASVDDAVAALAIDGATVLAGGQSLVPLLALRLSRPTLLVDVNALDLTRVDADGGTVRLGALLRHRRLERDPAVRAASPLLAEAAALIGHAAIRHRGTLGGSLAHADPAAELPAALVALGGSVVVRGPAGARTITAADLFEGFLTTSLSPGELLVEVRVPVPGPRHGAAFCEWAPRVGDFAVAGVAVAVERGDDGAITSLGAAACGIGSTPVDLRDAVAAALGVTYVDDAALRDVAARVEAACAGDDDRAELAGLLAARALHRATSATEVRAA